MPYHKTKRIVDKALIREIQSMPCLICGYRPVDCDHIKTKGSGGGDERSNLAPLCRSHHQEKHAKGVRYMAMKYERYHEYLIYLGWKLIENRWRF